MPTPWRAALVFAVPAFAQVTTWQYDSARTGANLHETILTPANVNAAQFGKQFRRPVDGDIYAQPLYLPHVEIPGKGVHNVVYVATEHGSVYAFDADGQPAEPLWKVSLLGNNSTTVRSRDVSCPFIAPEIGITPTPVIDLNSGTLYVLARTRETRGILSPRYVQRLHALAITTGAEKFGGPVEIQASVKGRGAGGSNGQIAFDPAIENPRAALLLVNNRVYLTWGSSCDVGAYHGWVMAYDAHTLAQVGIFNTSPDAQESGIWQSDAGPAADAAGNVYVVTGNGKFDAPGRDYGDSVLKLALGNGALQLLDYFTPFNQRELNSEDKDLGSSGPVLLPDQPGPHPHLLVMAGKGGMIYLLDRDQMGKYQADNDSHAVQTLLSAGTGAFGAPAYWNHHLYYLCSNDVLKDFAIRGGRLSATPVARGSERFIDPGAIPAVSSNGTAAGIVWLLSSKGWRSPDRPAVLHAYDAANVARELYNSHQNSARDEAGLALRFAAPMIVNGRVYVGAKSELDVYGLLK
ncbi:MAG: pyrrolo-quinoline quinone [Acidobacteriota bacterium]|nr:pyrrolo-quinoline quinone [Acidobacteriota bacterium]